MRLGGRGPILRPAGPDRSVPLQLPGDRRRRTTQLTRDLSHPTTTSEQDRDLLPLGEGQITPRHRREIERRHPATLAEPPDTNARQDTRLRGSVERLMPLGRSPPRTGPGAPDAPQADVLCHASLLQQHDLEHGFFWASQLLNVGRCDNQLNSPHHRRVIRRPARRPQPIRRLEPTRSI